MKLDPDRITLGLSRVMQGLTRSYNAGASFLLLAQNSNVVGGLVTTDGMDFDPSKLSQALREYADAIDKAHAEGLRALALGARVDAIVNEIVSGHTEPPRSILHPRFHMPEE